MLENQVFPIPRDSLQIGGNQKERHYELMDKDEYRDISLHHLIRKEKKKFSNRIREFDRLFEANRNTPENVTDEEVCVYLCTDCHLVWNFELSAAAANFCSCYLNSLLPKLENYTIKVIQRARVGFRLDLTSTF